MKHRIIRTTALALLVGACVVAVASARHSAAPARAGSGVVRVPWIVLETGPGARSLVIQYRSARCATQRARAQVRETSETIAIEVRQPAPARSHNRFCNSIAVTTRLHLRLRSAVAGRAIQGEGYHWKLGLGSVPYLTKPMPDPPHPEIELPLVPRVLGLSPAEATDVLTHEGFQVKTTGSGRTEVTAQSPSRGHLAPGASRAAPYDGVVTLTIGR